VTSYWKYVKKNRRREKEEWIRNWMGKKKCGASETIIRELRDNDPLEFKSFIRLTPEEFEELLLMISPIDKPC